MYPWYHLPSFNIACNAGDRFFQLLYIEEYFYLILYLIFKLI